MNWFRFRSVNGVCGFRAVFLFMFWQLMSHPSEPNTIQIIPAFAYTTNVVYIKHTHTNEIYNKLLFMEISDKFVQPN